MHPLIHAFYGEQAAGIFDMDEKSRQGRFEWFKAFQDQNENLIKIGTQVSNSRYETFNATSALPISFQDYLPGAFAKQLLKEALRDSNRSVESLSTLAWLSLTGDRGMGAFRFEPAGYPELNATVPIDLDRLVRWSSLILQGKGSEVSDRRLRELLRCGLFVKGSFPKIMVAINDYTGEVMSGQGKIPSGFDAWIMKLDGVVAGSAKTLAEEYACYQQAKACNIQVAACRIMRDGHWKHLMIKRFDRASGRKIPFVTCPSDRTSWEEIFRLMRTWKLPYPDMDEMFRRLIFNIFTNNTTYDTTKICFIFTQGNQWRLAPAFHLNATFEKPDHTLSLLDKTKDWSIEELVGFGKQLNIRKASKIIDELGTILL